MENLAALNIIGLVAEIGGVLVLGTIDVAERRVLEAQTRLQKAHDAYLQNTDNEMTQLYLSRCNNPEDRALVDAYDPRDKRRPFRFALWLLGLGMLAQLLAAAFPYVR